MHACLRVSSVVTAAELTLQKKNMLYKRTYFALVANEMGFNIGYACARYMTSYLILSSLDNCIWRIFVNMHIDMYTHVYTRIYIYI